MHPCMNPHSAIRVSATSLQAGLPLDTHEATIHVADGEDVRGTPPSCSSHQRANRRTLQVHKQYRNFHLKQHFQLTEAGITIVQEDQRQQLVRVWLRKVAREYTRWEWAACKEWEDSVIVSNCLWWAGVHAGYQAIAQTQMKRRQQEYEQASRGGVQMDTPQSGSKRRRWLGGRWRGNTSPVRAEAPLATHYDYTAS